MHPAIDLTPRQYETVLGVLKSHLPGTMVWAYGSRVKWTARPFSDLDLVVFTGPEQNLQVANLRSAFEESSLPFRVDLFVWDRVSDQFRKNIEAERVVLVERKEENETNIWPLKPVSDLATAIIGGTPDRSVAKYWDGAIPWATARDVAGTPGKYLDYVREYITEEALKFSSAKKMPARTIIITARGTVGALVQLKREMAFNQTCYALLPNDEINNDYLYYALKATIEQMRTLTYGTVFDTITRLTFTKWRIPLPSLSEQNEIANILGALDDKIEVNSQISETIETIVQVWFKSWFIDFDPVYAKATLKNTDRVRNLSTSTQADSETCVSVRDFDRRAHTDRVWSSKRARTYFSKMNNDIAQFFPSEFECSTEMGRIPRGWKVTEIGDIVELVYGKALAKKERKTGHIPVYGSSGIVGYHNVSLVEGPGIIVGRKGTVGSVYWEMEDFYPIDTVFFVKLKKRIPLFWIYQILKNMDIATLGADSAVPGVNRNAIYAMKCVLPIDEILEEYWVQLSCFTTNRQKIEKKNNSLYSLLDLLLPKLLSGEILHSFTPKNIQNASRSLQSS